MSRTGPTAREIELIRCQGCGRLSRPVQTMGSLVCPRCSARLHLRIPNSVSRCWTFLIAAYILYLPANFLPIMETSSFSGETSDTIMSGIISLWNEGSWEIAVIVFVASITVPLLKLVALTFLLISLRSRSRWRPKQRTRLYRMIRLVGRWSMLDIYVVAILTRLVHFNFLATVRAGPAVFYFAAVVVFTLIAARQFDPRIVWDTTSQRDNQNG